MFSAIRRTADLDQTSAARGLDPGKYLGAGSPDMVIFAAAGMRWTLPVAVTRDFGLAVAASPVPFAPDAFEGLVDADGLLAAQLDLSRALGGAGGGRYSMLVDSAAGPLRLRVESVAFAASAAASAGLAPGLPEIATLAAAMAAADVTAGTAPPPAEAADGRPFEALIVRSAGTPVALPALVVERVGRHRGARENRRGAAGELIVAIEDDILPGWSLAERLELEPGGGGEGWAVVIRLGGRRFALTVGEVHGVEPVPSRRVRRIHHGERASLWLPDTGYGSDSGLIELVDPGILAGGGSALSGVFDPADLDEPAAPPEQRVADRGKLAVSVGPFSCVVPTSLIGEVLGDVGAGRVSRHRFHGALPLLDAAPLLGLPSAGGVSGRVLVINRRGRRRLALRVNAIAPAALTPPWRPLPALPVAARRLFQAVRLEGEASTFLLREDVFDRACHAVVAGLPEAAFLGWLGGF